MATHAPQPGLRRRLDGIRGALRRRNLAQACVEALALFCGVLILLDGWNRLTPMREGAAFWGVVLAAAGGLMVLGRRWFEVVFRPLSAVDLALEVEQAHPEFMDSLVCATELSLRSPDSLRSLEKALIANVEAAICSSVTLEQVFAARLRLRRVLLPGLVIALAAGVLLRSQPVRKAGFHLADMLRGQPSGLVLQGPPGPVPVHSDVRVGVQVKRWEDQAWIVYHNAEQRQRFRMNPRADRRHGFTFYGIEGALKYRIETPSLVSPWQQLPTYVPPEFREVEMRLESPAYTGRDPLVFREFRNGTLVEGGEMTLALRSADGVTAAMHGERGIHPLEKRPDGTLTYRQQVRENLAFQVVLTTPEGWQARGPETRISVEPDLPPVVALLEPRQDIQVTVGENVDLALRASDDFGVQSVFLTYSLSGGPRRSVSLFTAVERTVEEDLVHLWDLGELGVAAGDVISYSVVVADNRVPEPRQSRSEVQFIVVRPQLDPQESAAGQGEQKELDIGSIIAELKRLIRFTWDIQAAPSERHAAMNGDLGRDLQDLRLDLRRKLNDAVGEAGGMMPQELLILAQAADEELGQAILLAERQLPAETLPPQERALAKLVALENELLKNAAQSSQPAAGSSGEESDQPPQTREEAQSRAQAQRQAIEAIKEALENARDLAQRQDRLNRDVDRESHEPDPQVAGALGKRQETLRSEAADLAQRLQTRQETNRASREMKAAEGEMNRAEARLVQNDMKTAGRHGARAHNLLLAAIQSLDEGLRQAAANQVQTLAREAQELSNTQRGQAGNARRLEQAEQPADAQVDNARRQQELLRRQAETLQADMGRLAAELEREFPDAAEALVKAAAEARRAGTERSMTRAENALLYRRFARARREQVDAANALQQLAADLDAAARFLPSMSREELLTAMQRLRQGAQQAAALAQVPDDQAAEQLEALQEKGSAEMDALAAQTGDSRLQQLADDLSLPQGGDSSAAVGRRLAGMFQAAAAVLEQHLLASELKRRVGLSRQTAAPPEKYRRLVDQYFKELSREQ